MFVRLNITADFVLEKIVEKFQAKQQPVSIHHLAKDLKISGGMMEIICADLIKNGKIIFAKRTDEATPTGDYVYPSLSTLTATN